MQSSVSHDQANHTYFESHDRMSASPDEGSDGGEGDKERGQESERDVGKGGREEDEEGMKRRKSGGKEWVVATAKEASKKSLSSLDSKVI